MHADKRYIPRDCRTISEPAWICRRRLRLIGGGPAGLSAAFYLQKDGLSGNGIRERVPSGRYAVERYSVVPSGEKISLTQRSRFSARWALTFKCGVEVGKDVTIQQLREEGYQGILRGNRCTGRTQGRSSGRGC